VTLKWHLRQLPPPVHGELSGKYPQGRFIWVKFFAGEFFTGEVIWVTELTHTRKRKHTHTNSLWMVIYYLCSASRAEKITHTRRCNTIISAVRNI